MSVSESRSFFPIMRSSATRRLMRNPAALQLYVWLSSRARYKKGEADCANGTVTLREGECVYGREEASRELNLTANKIRSAQAFLVRHGHIERKITNGGTIAKVCHYRDWALSSHGNHQETHQRLHQPATSDSTTILEVKKNERRRKRAGEGRKNFVCNDMKEAAELIVREAEKRRDYWDRSFVTHNHGEKCQDGNVCAFVKSKRPKVPTLSEAQEFHTALNIRR